MSLILYAHPFSSYCQKVLTALYENATAFEFHMLSPENPSAGAIRETEPQRQPAHGRAARKQRLRGDLDAVREPQLRPSPR